MTVTGLILVFLFAMPIVDWTATVILLRLVRPRIGLTFLTERAFSAIVLSIMTTIYFLVSLNTELGFPEFSAETARVIIRLAVVVLGAAPIFWLVVYLRRMPSKKS